MRSAGIISAFILSAVLGGNAHAQANESRVCKNLRHCVDIVERHDPDSFDYQVLNGEFQRFGKKGKASLINMLASKDETDIRRAQAVLAKGLQRFGRAGIWTYMPKSCKAPSLRSCGHGRLKRCHMKI